MWLTKKLRDPYFKLLIFIRTNLLEGKNKTFFARKRQKSIYLTKSTFRQFYPIYNDSLKILLDVVDLLIKEVEQKKDEKFNKATLFLLSRSIQHIETIVVLTENGLYGDAWATLRGVLSDMNMMYYLHFRQDLLDMFLNETSNDYQLNKKFKELFSEGVIERYLTSKGMPSIRESFQKISKAAHASSWGVQFYGTEGKVKHQYNLKYGPGFESKKALVMLTMIESAHWDYLNTILWHRYYSNMDIQSSHWEEVKKQTRELKKAVLKFNAISMSILLNYEDLIERMHNKNL